MAFLVERGGVELTFRVPVVDLHALTPSTLLESSGAVFHDISFTQSRNGNLEVGCGVYVAYAGFSFDLGGVRSHCVVTKVGGIATRCLDDMRRALTAKGDGETTVVRYFNIGDKNNELVKNRLGHFCHKSIIS